MTPGYRVFTTAYDVEHPISRLVRPELCAEYRERLDRRRPHTSAQKYGEEGCGLPESPALALRGLAGDRPAVLILDQLDAMGESTSLKRMKRKFRIARIVFHEKNLCCSAGRHFCCFSLFGLLTCDISKTIPAKNAFILSSLYYSK